MGSLRCKHCLSFEILFTPGGLTCDECGGHDLQTPSEDDFGTILDHDGQVVELERMFAMVDPR